MSVRELKERIGWIDPRLPVGWAPQSRLWRHLENMPEPERTFLAVVASSVLELDERLSRLTGPPISEGTCESTCASDAREVAAALRVLDETTPGRNDPSTARRIIAALDAERAKKRGGL